MIQYYWVNSQVFMWFELRWFHNVNSNRQVKLNENILRNTKNHRLRCSAVDYQPNHSDYDKIVCFVHEINSVVCSAGESVSSQPSTESQEKFTQNEVCRIRDFGLFERLLHQRCPTENYQMGTNHRTHIGNQEYCRSTNSIPIEKFHLDFSRGIKTNFLTSFLSKWIFSQRFL